MSEILHVLVQKIHGQDVLSLSDQRMMQNLLNLCT